MPPEPLEGLPDPEGADCVACGRCCHHGPRTVSLLVEDEERIGEELLERLTVLERRPPFFRFMRSEEGRCAALDVSEPGRYPCSVYPLRPGGCRMVAPGSRTCLEARSLGRLGRAAD